MKIFIKAKPNARKEQITKIDDTHFMVSVKEPPIKGRANQAIINLLADYFKLPKNKIEIISGLTSKEKIIEYTL